MPNMNEFLPLLIPLGIIQAVLLLAAWIHILTHANYKRGNRIVWFLVSIISIIGPVCYFVFGKEDA